MPLGSALVSSVGFRVSRKQALNVRAVRRSRARIVPQVARRNIDLQVCAPSGVALRFRANVYVDLTSSEGFGEDKFVGRSLRIGSKVTIAVLQRDARCMMITLDPDTAEKTPAILKAVAKAHEGMAGVYGAVLVEGMLHKGDPVELLN